SARTKPASPANSTKAAAVRITPLSVDTAEPPAPAPGAPDGTAAGEIDGAVGGAALTVVLVTDGINVVVVLAVVLVVVDVAGTVEVVVDDPFGGGGSVVVVELPGFLVVVDGTVVVVVDVLVVVDGTVVVVEDVLDVVDGFVVVVDGTVVVVVVVVVRYVVVVWQCAKPKLLPSWSVEAFDVSAGSATKLMVTTATTTTADRNPLNSRVVLVRHIPTNSGNVSA